MTSRNFNKWLEIQERIKAFTQQIPSNNGVGDPAYKSYLANCAKLYEIDIKLNDICNLDLEDKEFTEELLKLEKEVKTIYPERNTEFIENFLELEEKIK